MYDKELRSDINDIRYLLIIVIALQATDHPHSAWFRWGTVLMLMLPLVVTAVKYVRQVINTRRELRRIREEHDALRRKHVEN